MTKSKKGSLYSLFFENAVYILGIIFFSIQIIISFYKINFSPFNNESFFYYSIILFCLIIIIIFIIIIFKLDKKLKIGFSITLITSSLCIIFIEVYLEYKFREILFNTQYLNEYRMKQAEKNSIYFDTRKFDELSTDLKRQNINLNLNIGTTDFLKEGINDLVPLGGPSHAYKSLGNELGYYSVIKTDEYGFNNISGLYNKKIDIGLIGDSYAAGQAVYQSKNIASVIRQNNLNAISFGRVGIGPLIEYAIFREYVDVLKPKNVLWLFYENDLNDLVGEKKYSLLNKYFNESEFTQNLIKRQKEIDDAYQNFNKSEIKKINKNKSNIKNSLIFYDSIIRILKLYNIRKIFHLNPKPKGNDGIKDYFELILTKTNEEVLSWGGNFYLVYIPSYKHVVKERNNNYSYILETSHKLGISLIDIYELVFLKHVDPLSLFPFKFNGHYNEKGYDLVGKAIVGKINIIKNN